MSKYITVLIFSLVILSSDLLAQQLPDSKDILSHMETANNYFMAKWPDPEKDIITDKTRPSNLWTRATYYEGLMALYYLNRDTALYKYAIDWGTSHQWRPTYGSLNTRDGDHQCCGQTYIELYLLDPKPERIAPITTNIENMINTSKIDDWSWIDAIQMSMPVFAKLGVIHNDQKYFNRMYQMYNYTKTKHGAAGLYNPTDGLWWRDGNFDPPFTTPNGKMCYWSRGNGWIIAALARVLDVLPENNTNRQEYIDDFTAMSAALIKLQREDGFWNSSLTDPDDWGGKETSGTAFFVYGLAWGINNGFLDEKIYLPSAIKGWNGMANEALHQNGFLGWVQSTGKEPKDGQPLSYTKEPNFEDYGLGAFLLAGSEVYKLSKTPTSIKKTQMQKERSPIINISINRQPNSYSIRYEIVEHDELSIDLIDLNGKTISKLSTNKLHEPGQYQIELNGNGLTKGIYLVRFHSASILKTQKFIH
ncbi:MAG: glycoside hydrolase family 88 protein [Prolixibacteraceae bacterium]|jgi:unsaturated rhamnogalacturonyl hydrolase|nr:glycoside hydrolase family 88 protein [Prolixibacteraceae bacterium]